MDPTRSRRRALTEHDRTRLRSVWRIVLAGPVVGVLAASVLGLAGGTGRAGLASLLLFSATGCIVASILALLHAVVDEYRQEPVAPRRVLWGLGLMLATVVLLVLLGGVAGGGAP